MFSINDPGDLRGWPWNVPIYPSSPDLSENFSWPRISIVTPSYNQGQFIEETIRSVLLQGYPNLEYIIIDGGSTDNSVEIIRKYESQLAYWVSEKDGGQSQAINKGFEHATGEILAWLCSDDVLAPEALRAVAESIAGKSSVLLVGESLQTFGPNSLDGKPDKRRPTWQEMAYEARTFPQPSTFWTSDLWKASGGLDESLYFAMDYDLWLKMRPLVGMEIYLDTVLSYARTHEGQKGRVAAQQGVANQFSAQRAYAAVRAVRSSGESLLIWIIKIWVRRFHQAISQKKIFQLKGSLFHWHSTKIVFLWLFDKKKATFFDKFGL